MIGITPKRLMAVLVQAILIHTRGNSCHGFSRVDQSFSAARTSAFLTRHNVPLFVSKINDSPPNMTPLDDGEDDNDDDNGGPMDDATLLEQTSRTMLEDLCTQFGLPTVGEKETLLKQLRQYAQEQSDLERKRQLDRKARVEEGTGNEKERYEIVDEGDDIEEEEEEGYFFIALPEDKTKSNETNFASTSETSTTLEMQQKFKSAYTPNNPTNVITAPAPPLMEPNENGERVVTVYSTTDQNDLTGIAAAQPGQGAANDPMFSGTDSNTDAPWDTAKSQKGKMSAKEMDAINDEVIELVQGLLATTGAPAFQDEFDDMSQTLGGGMIRRPAKASPGRFTGFDPTKVPTDMLTKSARALRANRGRILQEVLRDFELRAVGYDGAFGDDKERGGGHYNEVSKVGAFLEGVRRADVTRLARETVSMLLDKLASDGVDGIDITLASMTRNSGEASEEAGELNDALLDYLNDAIRQQERRVQQMVGTVKPSLMEIVDQSSDENKQEDPIEKLWSVDSEDGQQVETFNPNDPKTKKILTDEFDKSRMNLLVPRPVIPKTAPEKMLLLLKMLRERVKTEAAFPQDEKARNLRILAYCLQISTEKERKQLLEKELGSSFDRLDSFAELVASSIEYGESTSHQLQPSKTRPLNIPLLNRILEMTQELRERQARKASGGGSSRLAP